jgi:flagellar hook-associated protein 3 FlgL
MTTRLSTAGFHAGALNALLDAQARLARTQQQIASGQRVLSPSDDPLAATRIQDLTRHVAESGQYLRNVDVARGRLSLEEQALADSGTSLQRIRELVLQASSDTTDAESRRMIADEIRGQAAQLLDIANRKDAQDEYLFSGLATRTQPFVRANGSVQYVGDQGQRLQQVGATQRIADGDPGSDVFARIPEGNGTFVTAAVAANTGSGSVSVGTVIDRSAWTGSSYTVQFTSASNWQVVDSATPTPNVVAAGTYQSGQSVVFAGISLAVTGTPVAGDSFTVRPAGSTDLFSSLDALVAALSAGPANAADKAQFRTTLDGSLAQIDQSLDHLLQVRSGVGVRLGSLDSAQSAQEDAGVELRQLLSGERDLDYAEAVTRLNVQYTSLQAAQKSLASIGQLSLFDYL